MKKLLKTLKGTIVVQNEYDFGCFKYNFLTILKIFCLQNVVHYVVLVHLFK